MRSAFLAEKPLDSVCHFCWGAIALGKNHAHAARPAVARFHPHDRQEKKSHRCASEGERAGSVENGGFSAGLGGIFKMIGSSEKHIGKMLREKITRPDCLGKSTDSKLLSTDQKSPLTEQKILFTD